jgi:hypothetical protein
MVGRIPQKKTGRRDGPSGATPRRARRREREYIAASFRRFSGRTLSLVVAGLAANHCSSLVNGLMPLRLGLAGTLTELIFSRPGRVKVPAPFLLTDAKQAPSSADMTERTSRAATPLDSLR